ncbi:hypothetical protein GCM10007231_01860 [Nocardioides daphniae]|uniref:Uncharacterized protein n=1 Tax=Nocardioides daphniae TaxID=402297 RepID=A0ABQ1PYN8_9ACTN|nr:hypothetical protein GCM10007231_01860 [Nocardioides daphniae]
MSYEPKPRTSSKPSNKSVNARGAEGRGERTWTNWRLRDLVEQVIACNRNGLSPLDVRAVKPLEYLKVKLLVPTEPHHVRLRMPDPLTSEKVQYYGLDRKRAEKLRPQDLRAWKDRRPSSDELDEMVENLTGRVFYRQRRD